LRTTGAPKSATPGADGADNAVTPIAAAAALLVETCATLAIQAARRGGLGAVRYLLEQALRAVAQTGNS
jgi:type IV secretory pathway protease TraF